MEDKYDRMKKWEIVTKIMQHNVKLPYLHTRPKSNLIEVLKTIEDKCSMAENGTIYLNKDLSAQEINDIQEQLLKASPWTGKTKE